ncbi:hypothetical protein PS850_01400 [Pseudomonas fluorescens]|nr:hypothetical protein PS850_01400 [Pseudomonas fluorescens]
MKFAIGAGLLLTLSGCVSMSGEYQVSGQDASGAPLKMGTVTTQGRGIYTVRNALCQASPGATVIIRDNATGKELSGESPYQCR